MRKYEKCVNNAGIIFGVSDIKIRVVHPDIDFYVYTQAWSMKKTEDAVRKNLVWEGLEKKWSEEKILKTVNQIGLADRTRLYPVYEPNILNKIKSLFSSKTIISLQELNNLLDLKEFNKKLAVGEFIKDDPDTTSTNSYYIDDMVYIDENLRDKVRNLISVPEDELYKKVLIDLCIGE